MNGMRQGSGSVRMAFLCYENWYLAPFSKLCEGVVSAVILGILFFFFFGLAMPFPVMGVLW